MTWLAAMLGLLSAAEPLRAGNLVPTEVRSHGTVPASAASAHLVVIEGRALVIADQRVWLAGAGATWAELTPGWESTLAHTFGDGRRAYGFFGDDGTGTVSELRELSLIGETLRTRSLPPLPGPLTQPQGTLKGATLFVHGVDATGAHRLFSLLRDAPGATWLSHAGVGSTGVVSALVAQEDAVFAIVEQAAATSTGTLHRWTIADGWTELGDVPGRVVPGTARAVGQAHVQLVLRDAAGGAPESQLVTFHSVTRAWARLGSTGSTAARRGAPWQNGVLLAAGDGDHTLVNSIELVPTQLLLGGMDWMVIALYLSAMTGIGVYFYVHEKKHSTADFFVGSRTIPFWAAGISLYATNTSSISYIAIPAKAFATNWQYLMNNLVAVLGLLFVAAFIVPLLRRLDLMSVFHYLELRFHPAIRSLTSALCILMQLGGRMSVVLFLPSLAISTITGLEVVWSILIMGGITIAYTTMGGMKAVIWTDFVQIFVMFGGAIFAIGFILFKLDGGLGEFLSLARAEEKMKVFDWSFDLTKATVWGFVFLVVFDVVLTFPKDQVLMQRVLSTKSSKEAGRSVWTFAAIMVPGGFLFYLIGTALYVFYKTHPERMNPLLSTDATFPLFIAAELPIGITGLIIAGIFAASMSTLSSIMNSVSTLASVDFYEKIARSPTRARSVRFAEWMTVLAGLIGMALALLLSRYDIDSLFDVSIELSGLLGGGFAGAYTLGMFTRRANWQGVAIGIGISITLTMIAWSKSLVHPYFYLAISILICITAGYIASWFFPPPARSLEGLTIFSPKRSVDQVATELASVSAEQSRAR